MRKSRRKQKEGYAYGLKVKPTHKIVYTPKKNKYGLPDFESHLVSI